MPMGIQRGEVYPRVCGGTSFRQPIWSYCEGLSPRVRGNLRRGGGGGVGWRSIPACAGEPRQVARRPRRDGVYPRVCGGTSALG